MTAALRHAALIALCALASLSPATAGAEMMRDIGRFIVHYNAMATQALDPALARAHAIRRAAHLGILNVAVSHKRAGGNRPVAAMVTASVSDARGRITPLTMREVRDGNAVYYVGEFAFEARQTLRFQIDVSPEQASPPYMLTFEKQFME